jgi:hypothetical protein
MGDESWLDSSKVESFKLCPQKYEYRFEEHLVPLDRKRDSPIMFGGAIHRALETLYRGTAFNEAPCPLGPCQHCHGNAIPNISAVFLANYTDDPDDPREIRTVDRGLELLVLYLSKWRREQFRTIAVEVPFELPYETRTFKFNYIGRIDLIVEQEDLVMTVDHKTTTRFGLLFDSSFKLSGQFTGYMKGASKLVDREITTALANAMRISTKLDDASFARIYTHRTPEDFDRWEAELLHTAKAIDSMRFNGFWPRNAPFACGAYNRICEYWPLCVAGEATREHLKQAAYERIPWEPRKVDE